MSWTTTNSNNVRVKKFSGTTPGSQGGIVTIANVGIEKAKIISISAVVDDTPDSAIPPEFSGVAGFQYSVWLNSGGLNLKLSAANSINILNKNFVIIVVHVR